MSWLADEPVELLSLSIADLDRVCAGYPSEVIDNHFRVHGGCRIHAMMFVGGGHFTVTYTADNQPQAYAASGVRFVRWDAETNRREHPTTSALLVPASSCHLVLLDSAMMRARGAADCRERMRHTGGFAGDVPKVRDSRV